MIIGEEMKKEKITYQEPKDKNFIGLYRRMIKVGSR